MKRRAVVELAKSIQVCKALTVELRDSDAAPHQRVLAWSILAALSAAETAAEGLLTEIDSPEQDAAAERLRRKEE